MKNLTHLPKKFCELPPSVISVEKLRLHQNFINIHIKLRSIHNRYFCTQYCDKEDKKDIKNFDPWVSMMNQDKLVTKLNPRNVRVLKELTLVGH